MIRRLFGIGLLLAFVSAYAVPANGADKKKQPADDQPTTDADDLPPGQFNGKLKTPPGSDGSFIVAVEYQHLVLKPGKQPRNANPQMKNLLRDQQKIAKLQAQVASARTARQQVQYMQQLQSAMNTAQLHIAQAQLTPQQSPFMLVTDTKDVTFHSAEEMKVRFSQPPAAFDDKGNVKKYTADELKELKGKGDDAKLVGYEGSVEKLTAGMPVQVKTVRNKTKKDVKTSEDKTTDEKKTDDMTAEEKAAAKAAAEKAAAEKAAADKAADKAAADKKTDDKDKDPLDKKDMGPKTVVKLVLVIGDETSGTSSDDSTNPKKKKKNN